MSEAIDNRTLETPALHEDMDTVRDWVRSRFVWTVRWEGRLVAAVRAHQEGSRWEIGRLMVAPDLAERGLGRWLLRYAESQAPAEVSQVDLFTGSRSTRNLRMYRRAGYRERPAPARELAKHIVGAVFLTKPRPGASVPGDRPVGPSTG